MRSLISCFFFYTLSTCSISRLTSSSSMTPSTSSPCCDDDERPTCRVAFDHLGCANSSSISSSERPRVSGKQANSQMAPTVVYTAAGQRQSHIAVHS